MIKIENTEVMGWEHAIRGMRNPMNSWEKSDSKTCLKQVSCDTCPAHTENGCIRCYGIDPLVIGSNDHQLMMNLAHGGPVHAKYRRMITVYLDITAPLYWWKEFDTYKVGTVANSCSTMHKIHAKEFFEEDFSFEDIEAANDYHDNSDDAFHSAYVETQHIVNTLNRLRYRYLETRDKRYWRAMIQLLPTSYNQKRTVMLNYEVLAAMYESRKNHKLDEWREFCKWIEGLPYSELIVGEKEETDEV